jgi:hypothetical protein
LNAAEARTAQAELLHEDLARKYDESVNGHEQAKKMLADSQRKVEELVVKIQSMNYDQDTNLDALDNKFESMVQ